MFDASQMMMQLMGYNKNLNIHTDTEPYLNPNTNLKPALQPEY